MRCEACHGEGHRLVWHRPTGKDIGHDAQCRRAFQVSTRIGSPRGLPLPVPCDECGGSGIAHCCEGLRAQP